MSESSSSSTPHEPRRSTRNTKRNNRIFNQEDAVAFLKQHSVFPKFIAEGEMIRLLMEVQVSVEQMPPSDPAFNVSTTVAYHRSATMHSFDLDKLSDEMQHLTDFSFEIGGSRMTQVTGKSLPLTLL